ncbi:MAG: hypothetical protein IPK13_22035 [Deltaproteobacteria bacterium]|nr:hypothetical protein [Deltaproteobacteria bacterium]
MSASQQNQISDARSEDFSGDHASDSKARDTAQAEEEVRHASVCEGPDVGVESDESVEMVDRSEARERWERVGPFEVRALVARGPGTLFFDAYDAGGARRLLQVSRLRACLNEHEYGARREVERTVARRTAELVSSGEAIVHAHGHAETPALGRVLFWALPWPASGAPLLPPPVLRPAPLGAGSSATLKWPERDVIGLGLKVASVLAAGHERGWAHPTLTEEVLWIGEGVDGTIVPLGVPIAIPVGWLDESVAALRLAPEERLAGRVGAAGDIFRLGALLGELVDDRRISMSLADLLARMTEADPDRRPSLAAATRALAGLLRGSRPGARPASGSEAITAIEFASSLAGPTVIDRLSPHAGFDPIVGARFSAVEEPVPASALPSGSAEHMGPADAVPSDALPSDGLGSEQELAALAAAWAEPVLPSGESPWSAVVHPRGAYFHGYALSDGVSGEMSAPDASLTKHPAASVGCEDDRGIPRPAPFGRRSATAALEVDEGDDDLDVELAAAAAVPRSGRVVVAALLFLVVSGIMALLGRSGDQAGDVAAVVSEPEVNELHLDVDPPSALVVSEADGRVLGRGPLTFLVGAEQGGVVLLVAKGFEPLRLSLPQRGHLRVALTPLPEMTCSIEITSPEASSLTGVEVDIGAGPSHRIPGAAVIRPGSGRGRGARLVRCPELGGDSVVRLHFEKVSRAFRLRITEPRGQVAFVDGRPIGTIPTEMRTTSAFVSLRVGPEGSSSVSTDLHWVLMQDDAEVRLPSQVAEASTPRSSSLPGLSSFSTYAGLRASEPPRDETHGDGE